MEQMVEPGFSKAPQVEVDSPFIFNGDLQSSSLRGNQARSNFKVPEEVIAIIKSISGVSDIGYSTVFLGGICALLSRYQDRSNVVIKVPSLADRSSNQWLDLVVNIDDEALIADLILNVKKSAELTYSHQGHSFEEKNSREVTSNFAFRDLRVHSDPESESFDFILTLLNDSEVVITYDSNKFSLLFVEHFKTYLMSFLYFFTTEARKRPLGLVEYIPNVKRFLENCSGLIQVSEPGSIVERFKNVATSKPKAIGTIFKDTSFSYEYLHRKSDSLMLELIERFKVKRGDRVGIIVERSEKMLVAMLAVLKAGACYVPMDTLLPSDRINFIVNDCELKVCLIDSTTMSQAHQLSCSVYVLDLELDMLPDVSEYSHVYQFDENDLAYIIYTSGSTGKPKGVKITHGAILNTLNWRIRSYGLDANVVNLQIPSISFDSSVEDIFSILLSGGILVIPEEAKRYELKYLTSLIQKHNVTHFLIVPSFYKLLINELSESRNLKVITIAGEKVPTQLVREHFSRMPGVELINEYGPTENAVCSTYHKFLSGEEIIKIGRPIDNVGVLILDSKMRLMPIGVVGEIYLSGQGLAEGYLNDDDLSFRKFVANPFEENTQLYRTGDLGRWDFNGNIEFIGRTDNQVKIRGFRLELEEVENVIQTFAGVNQCVAKTFTDSNTNIVLACFYSGEASESEVRKFTESQLPYYMIPSQLIKIDSFRYLVNGKIDRKILELPSSNLMDTLTTPVGQTQKRLLSIWKSLLGNTKLTVVDNFFRSGGHSLIAMKLMSDLYKEMNVELSLREIFDNPTVITLSTLIDGKTKGSYEHIPLAPREDDYELSHAQRRLWLIEQIDVTSKGGYNISQLQTIEGYLDVSALEEAFSHVLDKHEILRTVFAVRDGEVRQKIISSNEAKFKIIQENVAKENFDRVANEVATSENLFQFDLNKWPLFRCRVLKDDESRSLMVFVIHHIISDEHSIKVLIKEVLDAYLAIGAKKNVNIKSPRLQYKDFAVWQNRLLADSSAKQHANYWLNQFSGEIPFFNVPADRPRPPIRDYKGKGFYITLDSSQRQMANVFANSVQASLFNVLAATVNLLFFRYTGQGDIIIGTPSAGRNHPDLEDQIGFYVNTLPLRTRLTVDDTFSVLVQKTREVILGAFEHEIYPFDKIVDDLKLVRSMNRFPLFDVMIDFHRFTDLGFGQIEDVKIKAYDVERSIAKFDLSFNFTEFDDGLNVELEYATSLFDDDRIRRMAEHFKNLLLDAVSNPSKKLAELSLTSASERETILSFNKPGVIRGTPGMIDQIIELNAEGRREHLAVRCGERSLTYGNLFDDANKLSHYLANKCGIRVGERVGLVMGRSEKVIVSILALFKIGACVVPIDDMMPAERIKYFIQDSGVTVLLTDHKSGNARPIDEMGESFSHVRIFDFDICMSLSNETRAYNNLNRTESDIAYILYTSGSSGTPKGVMIEHASLVDYALTFSEYFNLKWSDRILHQAPISFDVAFEEIFSTLISTATLVIAERGSYDIDDMINLVQRHEITITSTTPQVIGEFNRRGTENLKSLRALVSGGDELKPGYVDQLLPEFRIVNSYGPTEITICSTFNELKAPSDASIIGKPITNRTVYILDSTHELVPIGIPGELYIGGKGLARGYCNRIEETDNLFISHPFESSQRLYRTGDIGRWREDGSIQFLGREDSQVKINGYRIELREVEYNIMKCPEVMDCAVTTRELPVKAIVCFYTGSALDTDIYDFLRRIQPYYMTPARFIRLDKMPTNFNNKIDYKALSSINVNLARNYTPPQTPTEISVSKIWEEILQVSSISAKDNFFELGGNSLSAARMMTAIFTEMNNEVSLREIFEHPTIQQLAQCIESKVINK